MLFVGKGDIITDGNFTVRALHPGAAFDSDDRNEQSLVLSYQSREIKLLLTRDVGEVAIKSMLEQGVIK